MPLYIHELITAEIDHQCDYAIVASSMGISFGTIAAILSDMTSDIMSKIGEDSAYLESRWRELVESVTIYADNSFTFLLTDGRQAIALPK